MPDVPVKTVPLEFARLSKQQKRFVRKLTWERLKADAPFVGIVPSVIGCLGALIGIVTGVIFGRLMFFQHSFRCLVICVVVGAGVGAWIGRMWLKRECQPYSKNIIREHRNEIERLAVHHNDQHPRC